MARVRIVTLAALLALPGAASGQPVPEVEPLNSAPPGQPAGAGAPFWSASGAIAPGDVDFYDHGPVLAPLITANTFTTPWFSGPVVGVPPAGDTLIGAFGPLGLAFPVSVDDDDGPGLNSAHHFAAAFGFPLFHGVTGFPDAGFVGAHPVATPYRLVVSSAGVPEVEPNGVPPLATPMPPLVLGATANEGAIAPGDVDFFSLFIPAGDFVTASVYDFTPIGGPAMDTVLGVFDPGGILLGFDDDEGPALNSGLAFFAPVGGVYSFAVSGFADFGFVGAHGVAGPYRLVVSAAPVVVCYANCDGSAGVPILTIMDFACFLNAFASGDPYANCDGSIAPPVLNVVDFACFLNAYASGCP